MNPRLRLAGIVVNKAHTPLTNEHTFQIGELKAAFAESLRMPLLPRRAAVEDGGSAHLAITALSGEGAVIMSQLYRVHAEWMIEESA